MKALILCRVVGFLDDILLHFIEQYGPEFLDRPWWDWLWSRRIRLCELVEDMCEQADNTKER